MKIELKKEQKKITDYLVKNKDEEKQLIKNEKKMYRRE